MIWMGKRVPRSERSVRIRALAGLVSMFSFVALASTLVQSGCGRGISNKITPNLAYCEAGCPACAWSKPTAASDTTSPAASGVQFPPNIALSPLGYGVLAWAQDDDFPSAQTFLGTLVNGVW